MAMRGDDEISVLGDFVSADISRAGLHQNRNPGIAGGSGEPVVVIGDNNAGNSHGTGKQGGEGGHAEMARSNEGNTHCSEPLNQMARQYWLWRNQQ